MALSEDAKIKLRETIEKELEKVPEGTRIKLDNNLLNELIFFYGKTVDDLTFKVPIWTGKFLSKIDLSELSFDNVWFDYNFEVDEENIAKETLDRMMVIKRPHSSDCDCYEMPYVHYKKFTKDARNQIDFSNTNINVDFRNIVSGRIDCCNFSGVDLSKSNVKSLDSISSSDLSNTKIRFNDIVDTESETNFSCCFDSNFEHNDFSNDIVSVHKMWSSEAYELGSCYNNSFIGTGLKMAYEKPTIPQAYLYLLSQLKKAHGTKLVNNYLNAINKYPYSEKYKIELKIQEYLKGELDRGSFVGCYINGLLINKDTKFEDIPLDYHYRKDYKKDSTQQRLQDNNEEYFVNNIADIINSQLNINTYSDNQFEESTEKHI